MSQVPDFISKKRLTLALVIILVVTYPLELFTIAKWGTDTFEFWFLFTPGFTPTPAWLLSLVAHGTVRHLAINIVGLLLYGLVLERFITRKTYLGVYVSTGLVAGLIHTNLTQNSGAGASGAIMGIVGFYSTVYLVRHRPDHWQSPMENMRYILAILGPPVVAAQYVVDVYLSSPGYAHVVGGIIGGLLGCAYVMSQMESSLSRIIESARDSPFTTALLVLVLAETALIVHFLNKSPENAAGSMAVQAGATIILVLITIWYAFQTRRNADLFRLELELETQRNHADILQLRTARWLENLPEVTETSPESNSGGRFAIHQELQRDPYFEDLMENHATDLNDHVEDIQSIYSDFTEIRDDFIDNFDVDPMFPDIRQVVVLDENYAIWLFERIILLERTDNDKKDLQIAVENAFQEESYEEDNVIYLVGDSVEERQKPILAYHYQRSTATNRRDSYWNRVWAGIPQSHIREIESVSKYNEAVQAAKLLDELKSEIEQLEKKLIRYNEVPRFEGDCDLILDIE